MIGLNVIIVTAMMSALTIGDSLSAYSSGQLQTSMTDTTCYNDKGDLVRQGEQYFPLHTDICTECTCQNGRPEMCISVLCSPPQQCRQFHAVSGKCCEFVCLDGEFGANNNGIKLFNTSIIRGNGGDNRTHGSIATNNLGLRLIASTITSFLILALLLFMIHRLRQRRLLLMIRRLQTRRLEQVNGLSSDNPHMGYLSSHNCYEQYDFSGSFAEPPPPYTFWKPPEQYIPPGEAPPPYDDSVDVTTVPCFDVTNHSVVNNNTNSRVNITNNCMLGSPTPFQQTQLISAANHRQQSLCSTGSPFLLTGGMITTAIPAALVSAPIFDTISNDHQYEHITIVRINESQMNNNSTIASNSDNICGENIFVENSNTFSDSTSTSSIASSEEAFNSPSNCSVISSSSQSTSTQSTVRPQESHTTSRL